MLIPLRTELVANPEYLVFVSEEFLDQILECHNDQNVRDAVWVHFKMIVAKLEIAGPLAGKKWVKKLNGHGVLGEGRYNTEQGVAWRFFFKFSRKGRQRIVVFADMDSKNDDDFPVARYARAGQTVDDVLGREGMRESRDW
jgi:hypothetical protein